MGLEKAPPHKRCERRHLTLGVAADLHNHLPPPPARCTARPRHRPPISNVCVLLSLENAVILPGGGVDTKGRGANGRETNVLIGMVFVSVLCHAPPIDRKLTRC